MALLKTGQASTQADTRPQSAETAGTARFLSDGDPFAAEEIPRQRLARAAGPNDMYGLCSIEDFPDGIGDLGATHEDAGGFYNYVRQFVTPNFWLRDGSVLAWAYGEDFDNWQDYYGFDACTVVYHSGHGNMRSDGTFEMPMGGTWGGTAWVTSGDMRLGNEVARYVFLSTCLSLRVHDGHSPIRTWDASNLGFRMLFGYETTSIDSPNYGKFFFEEWNKNKSLSQAWLDASWRIDTTQAPSVVACGSSQEEAQDRLFNERLFFRGSVPKAWWSWRWYDAARRVAARESTLPESVRALAFAPPDLSGRHLSALASRYGLTLREAPEPGVLAQGVAMEAEDHGPAILVDRTGSTEVRLAEPVVGEQDAPGVDEAVRIASSALESLGLAEDVDLMADHVRHEYFASSDGEQLTSPRNRETVVVFTQFIDGQPVVTPGVGEVRVGIDSMGTITRLVDATRRVDEVREHAPMVKPPPDPRAARLREPEPSTVEEVLEPHLQAVLRRLAARGHVPSVVQTVPDSTEVGYSARGADGVPVVRRSVEIDCGEGLRKRFVIEAPLNA